MPQDPAPTSMTQLARECDERIAALHAKYDKHKATLDRLNQGIDRILAGNEPKADAQLEDAVFGPGPSAGFDAASRCMEDEEPFDDATGPMEPLDPSEYNPDIDPHFGTDADSATRVRDYGRLS